MPGPPGGGGGGVVGEKGPIFIPTLPPKTRAPEKNNTDCPFPAWFFFGFFFFRGGFCFFWRGNGTRVFCFVF